MSDTQNQWIPVSERLPEKSKNVLARTATGELLVAFIGGWSKEWRVSGLGLIEDTTCRSVTHWMDLPEPPQPPKPSDPFEAWWESHPIASPMAISVARDAWHAAKEHYAKPLPDFETWASNHSHANGRWVKFHNDTVIREAALFIWNAAQGKPEA